MATELEEKGTAKQIVCDSGIMEEPTMSTWNDDRLDEFSRRTDEGFKEMREGFAGVDRRFDAINERLDRLTNTLIAIGGAAFVAFLGNGIFG